jgi:dTDP-4-dehydrorhamnose reductase
MTKKKRLLISGGSGLLGVNWAIYSRDEFDVVLLLNQKIISLNNTTSVQYNNIASYEIALSILAEVKPDILIHTAGLTNVELCEREPELAYSINVNLSDFLSKACNQLNIAFVHISTDHLFAGDISMVNELTPLNPINVYGASKAKAEKVVLNNNPNALIIRTNFYCWGTSYRHSFSDRILQTLRMGNSIVLFDDVFYTPILAEYLIKCTHELYSKKQKGLFNVVGNERITKYEFGLKLASVFNLDKNLILKGKANDNSQLVTRPTDMSLSNNKLTKILDKRLPSLMTQLKRLYEQEHQGISNEILSI